MGKQGTIRRLLTSLVVALAVLLSIGCAAYGPDRPSPWTLHRHRNSITTLQQTQFRPWSPDEVDATTPLEIWKQLRAHYKYQTDGVNGMQAPITTWKTGQGDCEDWNVLFACCLLKNGYDVELAVGAIFPKKHWVDHVWTLLHLNGKTYFADLTRGAPKDLEKVLDSNYEYAIRYTIPPFNSEGRLRSNAVTEDVAHQTGSRQSLLGEERNAPVHAH